MAMAAGIDSSPAEAGIGTEIGGSKRWLALFVALAAGWGILFGYSAMFLGEDMPFRPNRAALPEPPAYGFPPMPRPLSAVSLVQAPEMSVRRVATDVAASTAALPPVSAPRAERADYVGTWGPNEAACGSRSRRRGFIPATITPERAKAGRTTCNFHDGRRTGNVWVMAAECSDRGRRWSSQVRLVVDGDRLTWTSGKGSSSYIRCGRRAG